MELENTKAQARYAETHVEMSISCGIAAHLDVKPTRVSLSLSALP